MAGVIKSNLMVSATIVAISLCMLLETYVTLCVVRLLMGSLFTWEERTFGLLDVTVCLAQLVSYLISPSVCYRKNLAVKNDMQAADLLWKNAKPVTDIYTGFYQAGQILWWGLPGKIVFAPAVWKMEWAGKTVFKDSQVRMLQFKSLNLIPMFGMFTLPILGDAVLNRSDNFEGKTSMAFCYNYLPIVDHLRKLDDQTLIGKMTVGDYTIIYFSLSVPQA